MSITINTMRHCRVMGKLHSADLPRPSLATMLCVTPQKIHFTFLRASKKNQAVANMCYYIMTNYSSALYVSYKKIVLWKYSATFEWLSMELPFRNRWCSYNIYQQGLMGWCYRCGQTLTSHLDYTAIQNLKPDSCWVCEQLNSDALRIQ